MTFPGRFVEHLIADKIDRISLSFLVDGLEIRRGGVAANISFGLGVLGLRPLLVGAVGPDFGPYRDWLTGHGVDCGGVRESVRHHTARFICTSDLDGNQIASFYPGAMSEDGEIELAPLAAHVAERHKADPTGTGDAFRAGFLAAIGWGLSLERAAQLGNLLAVTVLE